MINGIIEDDRTRIRHLEAMQKSHSPDKKHDCINTLQSYLIRHRSEGEKEEPKFRMHRDLAAHTLA